MSKFYAGIDLHKKNSVITLMDEKGYVQQSIKINNQKDRRRRFALLLRKGLGREDLLCSSERGRNNL